MDQPKRSRPNDTHINDVGGNAALYRSKDELHKAYEEKARAIVRDNPNLETRAALMREMREAFERDATALKNSHR